MLRRQDVDTRQEAEGRKEGRKEGSLTKPNLQSIHRRGDDGSGGGGEVGFSGLFCSGVCHSIGILVKVILIHNSMMIALFKAEVYKIFTKPWPRLAPLVNERCLDRANKESV